MFVAYLPLAFWKTVVDSTNEYAKPQKRPLVTIEEPMMFLCVVFYMTFIDNGEYTKSCGDQVENNLFDFRNIGLDRVMTLKCFQFIRSNLCFRASVSDEVLKRDPDART